MSSKEGNRNENRENKSRIKKYNEFIKKDTLKHSNNDKLSALRGSRNEDEDIQLKYRDKFENIGFEENCSPIMLEGGKSLKVQNRSNKRSSI